MTVNIFNIPKNDISQNNGNISETFRYVAYTLDFTRGAKVRYGDTQISVSKLIRQGENKNDEAGRKVREKGYRIHTRQGIEKEREREGHRDIAKSYERITTRRRGVEHVYASDLRTPDSP